MVVGALMVLTSNVLAQTWNEVSKIVASDREPSATFGKAVSISGHTAIAGPPLQDNENSDQNFILDEGAAYIDKKDQSGYWHEVQKILASDKDYADWFGSSVDISGNYVIVGAYVEDEDTTGGNTMDGAGSVYIFEKDNSGTWNEVQKIVPSDRDLYDYFGFSVAISGKYAIVGAILKEQLGKAYVFERDDEGIWNEVQKLDGDFIYGSEFGYSISIDEDYAIIGAPYESIEDNPGHVIRWSVGAAYIFQRDITGTWNRVRKLVATHREADDHYGISVSISGDNAIAGSHWEDEDAQESDSLYHAGAAYIYENDGTNNWDPVQKIVPSDRAGNDEFGFSVSISGDMVAVGAPMNDIIDEDPTHFTIGSTYLVDP